MMSLMGLYVATYLTYQDINKPTKPLTTVVEGKEIRRNDVKVDKYIQNTVEEEKWIDVIATAYCNCKKCTFGTGITASGITPNRGSIAVPSDIKMNTKFYIPDLEYLHNDLFTAVDRGGVIKRINNHTIKIDVWMPTHQEAVKFGIKRLKAKIIR